jgi:hypothetical protein
VIGSAIGSGNVAQNCAVTTSPFATVIAALRRFGEVMTVMSPAIGMKVTADADAAASARTMAMSLFMLLLSKRVGSIDGFAIDNESKSARGAGQVLARSV